MAPPKKPPLHENNFQGLKYFDALSSLLDRLHDVCDDHRRVLHYDQYLALLLLYFFNPVLTSLRSIQQASLLPKLQRVLKVPRTSLGSLSEAGSTFPPEYAAEIANELLWKTIPLMKDSRLASLQRLPVAVDGTLLKAVPRMLWAFWLSPTQKAAKVHLQFDLLRQVPRSFELTHGNGNEKKVLEKNLEPGLIYVVDRGYQKFSLFNKIIDAESSFVCRINDEVVLQVEEERELTQADKAMGIFRDEVGKLGHPTSHGENIPHKIRVIEILVTDRGREANKIRIATDLLDLPADLIAIIFRYRWQIELFFRWLKCTLGCKHLLAENPNGIQLQVYAALIASLLIVLWTGRKPTKRTYEILCLYFQNWATEEDIMAHLGSLKKIEA